MFKQSPNCICVGLTPSSPIMDKRTKEKCLLLMSTEVMEIWGLSSMRRKTIIKTKTQSKITRHTEKQERVTLTKEKVN